MLFQTNFFKIFARTGLTLLAISFLTISCGGEEEGTPGTGPGTTPGPGGDSFQPDARCGGIDTLRNEWDKAQDEDGDGEAADPPISPVTLDTPVTLDGVYVTNIRQSTGQSNSFVVQKHRECPGMQVYTNMANPATDLNLALGDQITFEVTEITDFNRNLQVGDQTWVAGDITEDSTGFDVAAEIAIDLETIPTLMEEHENKLVKSAMTATANAASGAMFTLGGNTYAGRFNGFTADLCATGTFTFANTALISEFFGNYQVNTFENGAIVVSGTPPNGGCVAAPTMPLVISEIGNNLHGVTAHDYVVIYNPNGSNVPLAGYYIGRDSSCSTSGGIGTEYDPLSGMIVARSYFLVGRSTSSNNDLRDEGILDQEWSGAISDGYCVVITTKPSGTSITGPDSDGVIDWVTIGGTGTTGEGSTRAPAFGSNDRYIQRRGSCEHVDSGNNANDFPSVMTPVDGNYRPKHRGSSACTP